MALAGATLCYANAVLPEAMIAAGVALELPELRQRGLDLLRWLMKAETVGTQLSLTPAGGRGPGEGGPAFDQQPIEAAALADACARAFDTDPDPIWCAVIAAAVEWFQGGNDAGLVMWDSVTGGGFDGLHADRVNLNQGAEWTLAVISTFQHARRIAALT